MAIWLSPPHEPVVAGIEVFNVYEVYLPYCRAALAWILFDVGGDSFVADKAGALTTAHQACWASKKFAIRAEGFTPRWCKGRLAYHDKQNEKRNIDNRRRHRGAR